MLKEKSSEIHLLKVKRKKVKILPELSLLLPLRPEMPSETLTPPYISLNGKENNFLIERIDILEIEI